MFRRALLVLAVAASVVPLGAAARSSGIVIVVPSDMTQEATGPDGATVTYTASAHRGSQELTVTCSPASGSTFDIRRTTVDCSARDDDDTEHRTFDVTVQDTTGPTVTVPADMAAEATSAGGAVVTFSASASDLVDGSRPVTCGPESGTKFAVGTTRVTCGAADTRENAGSGAFDIAVSPQAAPPLITVPADMTVEAQSASGAAVTYQASAVDWRKQAIPVLCAPAPGGTFGLGVTSITCAARDSNGRTSTKKFNVSVVDTQAPVITTAGPQLLSAKVKTGAVVNYTVSAADVVDGPVAATCAPPPGSRFAVGTTKVSCSATDRRSNTAATGFEVTVVFTPNLKARSAAMLSPAAGVRITAPPLLRWRQMRKARFYNVQVFRKGQKVLSAWPIRAKLRLRSKWTYNGHTFHLRPGKYTWLVWPAYGPAAHPRFGKLIGLSSFRFAKSP